jgi:aspartokinase/homoserine dehydrogenase 1
MQVLKFGGTSVANAENINKVTAIVQQLISAQNIPDQSISKQATTGQNPRAVKAIVVLSAFGGITDILIGAGKAAAGGDETYKEKLVAVEQRHLVAVKALLPVDKQSGVLSLVKTMCNELEDICN